MAKGHRLSQTKWGRRHALRAGLLLDLAAQTCILHEWLCLAQYRSRDVFTPVEPLGQCIYWSLEEPGFNLKYASVHFLANGSCIFPQCRSSNSRSISGLMAEGDPGSEQDVRPLLA